MTNIFLEISIEKTIEKEIPSKNLLKQIKKAYYVIYKKKAKLIEKNGNIKVRVEFPSKNQFEAIYEPSYQMYVYLFDNFITQNPEFKNLFPTNKNKLKSNKNEIYMVLKYETNCIDPLRRYFGFTTRVNEIFGSKVMNEEIENGYLRFIQTRNDFLALLTPADLMQDWKEMFQLRGVDLNHPLIQKFFATYKKYIKIKRNEIA